MWTSPAPPDGGNEAQTPPPNPPGRIVALCLPPGPGALHSCITACHRALIYNTSGFQTIPELCGFLLYLYPKEI